MTMVRDPEDLIETLVADLKPVTPERARTGMAQMALSMGVGVLAVSLLLGLRADLMALRPDPVALMATGLFMILALSSAWAALDMARPSVGVRRDGWVWTALMAAVMPAAALTLIADRVRSGLGLGIDGHGVQCMTVGLIAGLLTATILVVRLRRGAPTSPARAALLTGAAGGAAGIFAVSLCCPENDLIHIGVWHGGTVLLSAALGRLALPKLLAW